MIHAAPGIVASPKAAEPPVTPLSIAGCQLWLDAADVSTITDAGAGAVSLWADKSGQGRDFAQPTSGNRPVTGAATQNGRNVISFTRASSQFLTGGDVLDLGTNSVTWLIVMRTNSYGTAANYYTPCGKHINGSGDGRWGFYIQNGQLIAIYDPGTPVVPGESLPGTPPLLAVWTGRITRAVGANASSIVIRRNGVQVASQAFTDNGTNWNISNPYQLGKYDNVTNNGFFDGQIMEHAVWLRSVSDADIAPLEAALVSKWAA